MAEHKFSRARTLIAVLLTAAMTLPGIPVFGAPAGEPDGTGPRSATDNSNDLIIPDGEIYDLSGSHTYKKSVQINGTLKVVPYDGSDLSGTVTLIAPWIIVGPNGKILADGRGFGGGGGGCTYYDSSAQGGFGGTGGMGGNGGNAYPNYYCGGGGGGSNGGKGGKPGNYGYFGQAGDGTETKGGDGGDYQGYAGKGGSGFGGGGGGGGTWYYGPGGGGGGGTGGKDATVQTGGAGGGQFGGAAGAGNGGSYTTGADGKSGGYMASEANGDASADMSVVRGSGGGGGGGMNSGGGGAGGAGAGGASVVLDSSGGLDVSGSISATGGSGGSGGTYYGNYNGGNGGGGAGGGILLRGQAVTITGTVDARGRQLNQLSTRNGGTVKIYYSVDNSASGNIQGGRVYKNGRPAMKELTTPADDGNALLRPTFTWESAVDPEGDTVTYQIQVAAASSFSPTIIDESGIKGAQYTSDRELIGTEFFWRVRALDAAGPGAWSETWRFLTDITPPVSRVEALPEFTSTTDFPVSWAGTDDSSGIAGYTIWVAQDNLTFKPWLNDTPLKAAYYPGRDGHKYSFYSSGVDRAFNREAAHPEADTFTSVDVTPPVSGFVGLAPSQSKKSFPVFWSGKDSTSGIAVYDVYYSDNKGPFSLWLQQVDKTSAQFESKEFHEYAFYTIATDRAGNVEGEPGPERISRTKVDLTNPTTTITLGDPNYGANPTFITAQTPIYIAGSDSYSGLNETSYIIDDRPAKTFRDRLFESSVGSHNLTYWSTDQAGNREPDARFWFVVDSDLPLTTLSFNGANWTILDKTYISTQTMIDVKSFDRSSGVAVTEYNLDGRGYHTYTKPLRFETSGFHTITYRGIDNVGNMETEKSVKIMVDSTPPVSKVIAAATVSRQTLSISLNASDTDSGVAGIYFRITRMGDKPGDYMTGTEAAIEALEDHSADGNYTLQFYSVDQVGNTEKAREIKYRIDTQAFLDIGFKGEPAVAEATFVIQGKAEPGAKVTVNGVAVLVAPDGTFTHQLDLSEGRNKAEFSVTDAAGNTMTKTAYVIYNPPLSGSSLLVPILLVVLAAAVGGVAAVLFMRRRKGPAQPMAPAQPAAASPAALASIPPPTPLPAGTGPGKAPK